MPVVPPMVSAATGAALIPTLPAGKARLTKVKMTAMPQMVALFNGVGGGAVALIAWVEFRNTGGYAHEPVNVVIASLFAALVGSISFWGSNIAFGKLQRAHRAVRRGDGTCAQQHGLDRGGHDRRRFRFDPDKPDGQGDEPVDPGDHRRRLRLRLGHREFQVHRGPSGHQHQRVGYRDPDGLR
jgi:hypothetical protein